MREIEKARERYEHVCEDIPIPTACLVYIRTLEGETAHLQAELSKMTAWRKEEFERAERMADDWAEFCKVLDLEWGDQQHAVNQIVANFNKAAKEARAEALEDALREALLCPVGTQEGWQGKLDMRNEIAAAIRRLKEGA